MNVPAGHIVVGQVVGVFGVKGALKVEPRTDFPERFAKGARVFLAGSAKTILSTGWHNGQARILFEGITNPEDAEKQRGKLLTVPSAELPALEPDTYLTKDLIGCTVVDQTRGEIGVVEAVDRGPLYDMLRVKDALIPAIKQFVISVDLDSRKIEVALISGMEPGAQK